MTQSEQRLKELNARLANILNDKGVTASIDETTTELIKKVADIEQSEGGGNDLFDSLIDGSISGDIVTQVENIKIHAFSACENITSFSAPNAQTIGNTAFNNCFGLIKASFPVLTSFSVQTFYACRTLQHIYAPLATSLSTGTFQGCYLKIVKLPSLKYTSSGGFTGNSQLKIGYLPSLLSVGGGAFKNCSSLQAVIINTPNCTLSNIDAFTNSSIANGTGFIYFPDEAVETYKTATNWNTYASQIKGLSEIPQDILNELEAYNYGD